MTPAEFLMSPFRRNAPFQVKIIKKKGHCWREVASPAGTVAPHRESPKPCPQAQGLWVTLLGWLRAAPQELPPWGSQARPRASRTPPSTGARVCPGQGTARSRLCHLLAPAGSDVTSHQFGVLSHIRVTHRTPARKITERPISRWLPVRWRLHGSAAPLSAVITAF